MMARKKSGLPTRVYVRSGAYFWVRPTDEKWIRLCRVEDGQTAMFDRLAEEKRRVESDGDEGSMSRLVAVYMEQHEKRYADTFRAEWRRRGEDVRKAFKRHSVEEVDPGLVQDFLLGNWPDKLPTQTAMKGWLSKFFSWAVLRRHVALNPCREITLKKPKTRKVYIPHAHFLAIREALAVYSYDKKIGAKTHHITAKVPTGPEMQVFVDLCYLTCQRSTDIRDLRWLQVDRLAGVIHFIPSKTADSSGEAVDWPITPEIDEVLRRAKELQRDLKVQSLTGHVVTDRNGKPKTAAACRDAWRDALVRAKLEGKDYTVKDIRAKALTDAKKAGYDIEALQVAGAHTDRATTEGYIKQREVPVSTVRLQMPLRGAS
ncbi:integrase [Cupriavidus necator]|uniref:tyrosine-type recombinase/integrase n=1 Tax=Cupriavidus necator TaxID=106590 RepID=UPI00148F4677|nr:tyrosine-type recombinase/integrase [Cupriavidus necator]NOV26867.1 integrase [Cupriavidus necator]